VLHLLLLKELDLGVEAIHESLARSGRRHHSGGKGLEWRRGCHGRHLLLHGRDGRREEYWCICAGHGDIQLVCGVRLENMGAGWLLEAMEVVVEGLSEVVHGIHVEELLEAIIGRGGH
jgi:hypothetical protein